MAEQEKVDPTALTSDEATLILTVFETINVKATNADAAQVCALIGSAKPKLERIVRLAQPLASAAKLKEVPKAADEPILDDCEIPEIAQAATGT